MNQTAPPTVGYVLKMFPRLSETFILNEILELERQGLPLRIFSLKRPLEPVAQAYARLVQAPVTYLPERVWREPLRVLRAHWGVARRFPRGYWLTLAHVIHGRELKSLGRGLRRFCQTCCLVHELGSVRHLHAHFATDPTRLASWAQMICRIPFSVTTHAKDLFQGRRVTSPGLQFKLGRARFVVANSAYSATALRALVKTPVCAIYNGVDLEAFQLREEEPVEPLILSVGRLVEKKGFTDLILACRILREWGIPFRCEIIGTGPLEGALRELIRTCGLAGLVALTGPMPQKKVRAHYLQATVFALPCKVAADGDRDILPNVLKEAMAVGVPVVTTRLEGIDELITHGESGLLVPPGDPQALAASLECLLTSPALRHRLRAQARRVIEERFDLRQNLTLLKERLWSALQDTSPSLAAAAEKEDHEPVS